MKRKFSILIIIILAFLIVFFYPRECGYWSFDPPQIIESGQSFIQKDCDCVGIKYQPQFYGAGPRYCFGIPISYNCYKYSPEYERIDVPCE